MARLYAPVIIALALLQTHVSTGARSAEINVVFRYDDPSAKSDITQEQRIIEVFRRHNMCCTFGVIPYVCAGDVYDADEQGHLALSPEKTEVFVAAAREGVLEIAQHGYSHQANTKLNREYSEFAGLGYDEQLRRIREGKHFLEREFGMEIATFVPPWNTYDANTLAAVRQSGFRSISADVWHVPDTAKSLRFVPSTCGLGQIREAVEAAREYPDGDPLIVALFHSYDFRESRGSQGLTSYDQLEETLRWLAAQDDVSVRPMRDIRDADATRYAAFHRLLRFQRILPNPLRVFPPPWVYLSEEGIQQARHKNVVLSTALYTGVVLLGAIMTYGLYVLALARMSAVPWWLELVLGGLLLGGCLAWALRDGELGSRGAMATAGFLSWCIGCSAARLFGRRWLARRSNSGCAAV